MAPRISLAGRVGIEGDDRAVAPDELRRPAWIVLAYLVAERHRPVRRDELADVIWGEDVPASWDTIVRGLVSKVRAALAGVGLGRDAVSTELGCYHLHLPPGTAVDVEEAATAIAEAERALAAGDTSRAGATAARGVAVAASHFLPGAEGAWVERRQRELAELRVQGLEVVAQAASGAGDHNRAVTAAEEAVALDPLRESAHLRLIAAPAASGNRAEALRAYEGCRRLLAEELGVNPSAPVEATYLTLLREEPAVVAPVLAPAPLPPALGVEGQLPFVGRGHERQRLDTLWKEAVAGTRQAVLVGGEAGIGKTRLVAELAGAVHAQGGRVLYGRCDEELGEPYQPVGEVIRRAVTDASAEELAAHVGKSGAELARLVPDLVRRLPDAPPPAAGDPAAERWRLFQAADAFLAAASQRGPLLVVLDDMHWASPPALQLLRHLARSPTPASLLLVATYRDSELQAADPLSSLLADLRRDGAVERLALSGLDTGEVAGLVEAVGGTILDEAGLAVAHAVHAQTEGNAFFVGEVLRHLATSGALAEGRWPDPSSVETGIPEGVREVVSRRLLRLSAATNQVLTQAAVIGRDFDVVVLEELGTGRDDVLDALEEATATRLVVEAGAAGRFSFAHALVRRTVYDQLGAVARARLHRRVGEALEHLHGRQGAHLGSLAHHFCAGAASGVGATGADYALAAARAALEQAAPEEGAAHLQAGLAALEAGPPDLERRWVLLVALGTARAEAFRYDGQDEACLEAAALARGLGASERLGEVALLYTWRRDGGLAEAGIALVEEALSSLDDSAAALRAQLLCRVVVYRLEHDDGDVAVEPIMDEALALARRSGDTHALGLALLTAMNFPKKRGRRLDWVRYVELADEMMALQPPAPDPADASSWWLGVRRGAALGRGLGLRAKGRQALADRPGWEADIDELERRSRRRGDRYHLDQVATARTVQAVLDARWTDAEAGAADARVGSLRHAADLDRAHHLFRIRLEQGRLAELEPELAVVAGRNRSSLTIRAALAFTWVQVGEVDRGRRELDALVADDFAQLPRWEERPVALILLSMVCTALADTERAAAVYELLLPYAGTFTTDTAPYSYPGAADHYLGVLALTLGHHDEAASHFEAALELEQAMASPPMAAHTRLWHARLLATRRCPGDVADARTVLTGVMDATQRLGMARLRAEARTLLEDLPA